MISFMKNRFLILLSIPLILGASSCSKLEDFGDTNVNPGATTDPIVGALMTNAQASIGGYAAQTRGGLYAQYFSETQYTDASLYSLPQLAFTGEYSGVLYDLENIKIQNKSNNMNQVATILQQYIFWTITDRWGDVPYSEALKGNATPKYDRQEDIYKGMIAALAAAVDAFDNSSLITGDVIFGGNVDSWKKTANSIRMMMALQLSKKFPSPSDYAATEFKAALNHPAGYISTNAENFDVTYPGGNFKSNWWNVYDGRKDLAESETMTDLMSSLADPRQQVFGGETEIQGAPNSNTTSNVGVPYGVARATAEAFTSANPNWARVLRGDFRTENGTVVILSAGQVALARAEAANLGWTTENLAAVYAEGIQLSFEQWGLTMPATYLAQAGVAVGAVGAASNTKNIAIQRFIATYPNGLQGWNIWRKTGYPELDPAPDAINSSGEIVRRYTYSTGEYGTNKENVEAAAALIPGGDTQDSRVWWDQ